MKRIIGINFDEVRNEPYGAEADRLNKWLRENIYRLFKEKNIKLYREKGIVEARSKCRYFNFGVLCYEGRLHSAVAEFSIDLSAYEEEIRLWDDDEQVKTIFAKSDARPFDMDKTILQEIEEYGFFDFGSKPF